ncbi:MAG: phage scaffolding protein [Firmicutes bacterium]|nr:phage scaffolding protein [Bacillota bacterium]
MKKKDIEKVFPNITDEQLKELEKIETEAYERGKKSAEELYKKSEFERLLNEELTKSGAKNERAVKALLELEKIGLNEGKLSGFSEQIEELKKNCAYLFNSDDKKPQFTAQNKGTKELTKKSFENLGYKKRLKLFLENPALYKQLQER